MRPSPDWWSGNAGHLHLKRVGGELVGPCPHCGGTDRFAVRLTDGLVNCRGCADLKAILASAGWKPNGTAPPTVRAAAKPRVTKAITAHRAWEYRTNEDTTFQVIRIDYEDGSKDIRPDRKITGLGKPLPLMLGDAGDPLVIVEGETCAEAIAEIGYPAATWQGGAAAVGKTDWSGVRDRDVVLWPDNDDPGRDAMNRLADILQGCAVRVVDATGRPEKWDAADATETERRDLIAVAAKWMPPGALVEHCDWSAPAAARDWVVQDWLPSGRVALLTGQGGNGKSRLALQLAAAIAGGDGAWLPGGPMIHNAAPAPAMIVSWEDERDEIRRRLPPKAWDVRAFPDTNVGDRLRMFEGKGALWAPAAAGSRHISTMGEPTPEANWIRARAEALGARLLIFDPLAAAFACDENSRSLVRAFMASWDQWTRSTGCAVLIIAHPPKNGSDYSGSTDWQAAARTVWTLGLEETGTGVPAKTGQQKPPAPAPKLSCIKSSYGRPPRHQWLRRSDIWEAVSGADAAEAQAAWLSQADYADRLSDLIAEEEDDDVYADAF